eukprot:2610136-Amphidinium_carterae.1
MAHVAQRPIRQLGRKGPTIATQSRRTANSELQTYTKRNVQQTVTIPNDEVCSEPKIVPPPPPPQKFPRTKRLKNRNHHFRDANKISIFESFVCYFCSCGFGALGRWRWCNLLVPISNF